MNKDVREKVKQLKTLLDSKVKETIDHIQEQYTDNLPVFLNEGEVGDIDYDQLNAKNVQLALLRNVENRVSQFFIKVDETMEQVQFPNEKEWGANVEKEATKLLDELNGLR